MTKKPKYHNEQVLIYCMNREPNSLLFDEQFINYNVKTILELCEDLETNFDYLIGLLEKVINQESLARTITIANSLVWASLLYHHNDIVPEKYKQEDDKR
jgi:hypothetical protein